ncbi:spondin domain-containing protein [Granulosicoccus sp. 3-233]|uniref:spondin domain-containing protein n=1 Tax=Granulosicoccus sp. 3-233 TaxID=3417969 RepID=UPI003D3352D2
MHFPHLTVAATAALLAVTATPILAADYEVTVTNLTRGQHFTPLIAAAHDSGTRMFHAGEQASAELQAMAEGGDIGPLIDLLSSLGASFSAGEGLLAPGMSTTLQLTDVASSNSLLSLSGMLLPTNDGFVGLDSVNLPEQPGSTVTLFARGYDAGTEANDELLGGGAPGVPGFPAPPPVVATGTGTGGTGINTVAEGYVHVHPGVLGDLDETGGVSDINAATHRWQNPVARVVITRTGDGSDTGNGVSAVSNLSGAVYSSSALELFWEPAQAANSIISAYRVTRDGVTLDTLDGLSFFDQNLAAGTHYTYTVSAIDANGSEGESRDIQLTTNAR